MASLSCCSKLRVKLGDTMPAADYLYLLDLLRPLSLAFQQLQAQAQAQQAQQQPQQEGKRSGASLPPLSHLPAPQMQRQGSSSWAPGLSAGVILPPLSPAQQTLCAAIAACVDGDGPASQVRVAFDALCRVCTAYSISPSLLRSLTAAGGCPAGFARVRVRRDAGRPGAQLAPPRGPLVAGAAGLPRGPRRARSLPRTRDTHPRGPGKQAAAIFTLLVRCHTACDSLPSLSVILLARSGLLQRFAAVRRLPVLHPLLRTR